MYVLDKPIIMKVENFKDNILNIKDNWNRLSDSIMKIPELLTSIGFDENNIISYNAIMPIVYYLFKGGQYSKTDNAIKEEFKKYLVVAQMKRLYGVASTSTLTNVRNCLRKQNENQEYVLAKTRFSFTDLKDVKIVGGRTFTIDLETVDSWFEENKGEYTFFILTLLYPCARIGSTFFHQDHMHPESKLKQIPEFAQARNKLANLQLLEGTENDVKNDVELKEWLKTDEERRKQTKYLPKGDTEDYYDISNYLTFIKDREELMKKELKEILNIEQ